MSRGLSDPRSRVFRYWENRASRVALFLAGGVGLKASRWHLGLTIAAATQGAEFLFGCAPRRPAGGCADTWRGCVAFFGVENGCRLAL